MTSKPMPNESPTEAYRSADYATSAMDMKACGSLAGNGRLVTDITSRIMKCGPLMHLKVLFRFGAELSRKKPVELALLGFAGDNGNEC